MSLFVELKIWLISNFIPMISISLLKITIHKACVVILKYDVLFQRHAEPIVFIQKFIQISMNFVFVSKIDVMRVLRRTLTSTRR